ncbi:MAG: RNA methyltransferase, partial [Fibrobacteres bacterium]|nr:RNA methyltransferase [Fibrobacterota bacterium]
ILDNLRSAFNVGAIFRTSDAARIAEIAACGYTAHPPHLKLEKTALGTDKLVKSSYFTSTVDAVREMKQRGMTVVALETAEEAVNYTEFEFNKPLAVVVGNEALGISPEVLNEVDAAVQIPLYGYKNSLNVASAYAVLVFEIIRQWNKKGV